MERQSQGWPFVGREKELEHLCLGLDDLAAGRGRLYLIAGEPGIGKTRLIDELAHEAKRRGQQPVWGRCWESGGAPAYWLWTQVLRTCAALLDSGALTEQLAAFPDLAHVVPELRVRVPDLRESGWVEPEQGRFRVLDAATSFLRRVAALRPLVILLDDLHAADPSSLLLLRFLALELRSVPLLVVGAYRDTEVARDPVVAGLLADILREGEHIALRGLDAAAVARYVSAAAPRGVTAALVDAVYAVTEGNPLFVSEVVRLWIADCGDESGAGLSIPEELRAAIRQRLAPLPESVRGALAAAAIQGRVFDTGLLEEVAGASTAEARANLAEALDAARAAGVIQPLAGEFGRFAFVHVRVRDVLYDDLRTTQRVALHRRLGAAMERVYAADLSPHLAEIAHHYAQAAVDGEVDKAVEFARRAADRAAETRAYEDAVSTYDRALQVLPLRRGGSRPGDAALQCELLLSLGDAVWGAGDLGRMRQTFLRAAEVARGLPPRERGAAVARAALGLGGRQQRAHLVFDADVVRLLEEAREALEEVDSPLRARVLARLAYALYVQPGSLPRRASLCRQAVEMARRIGDANTLRWVLNDQRWALWGPDTIEDRLDVGAELTRLGAQLGDGEMVLGEHAWRMVDLLELGDMTGFDAELEAYTHLARQHPGPWYESYIWRCEAMRALLQGRFEEAERFAEAALAASKRTQHQDALLIYGTQMLALRIDQGRQAELEARVQDLVAQYPAVPVWRYVLALLQVELERPAETRSELERIAAGDALRLPADYLRLAAGAYVAEACAFTGDTERAALLYGILRPYARYCVVVGFGVVCLGSVSRYLGMLAATMGRRGEAAAHFEAALAANARIGARPALARTQLAYARMLFDGTSAGAGQVRASECERGERLLREAAATASELGMKSLEERAARLAAERARHIGPAVAEAVARPPVCRLRREGDVWSVSLGERLFRLKHLRGLAYVDLLLRRPGEPIHVFDLIDLADGATVNGEGDIVSRDRGDAGEILDATARAAYKQRLKDLREQLAQAEGANDIGHAAGLREEIETLAEHLVAATGLGGRSRVAASQANRARVAVAKAIRVSLARVETHCPELARHLALAVHTGTFCSYNPDPLHPVVWDLG